MEVVEGHALSLPHAGALSASPVALSSLLKLRPPCCALFSSVKYEITDENNNYDFIQSGTMEGRPGAPHEPANEFSFICLANSCYQILIDNKKVSALVNAHWVLSARDANRHESESAGFVRGSRYEVKMVCCLNGDFQVSASAG